MVTWTAAYDGTRTLCLERIEADVGEIVYCDAAASWVHEDCCECDERPTTGAGPLTVPGSSPRLDDVLELGHLHSRLLRQLTGSAGGAALSHRGGNLPVRPDPTLIGNVEGNHLVLLFCSAATAHEAAQMPVGDESVDPGLISDE